MSNDLVFSQLDKLGEEAFEEFETYAPPSNDEVESTIGNDEDDNNMDIEEEDTSSTENDESECTDQIQSSDEIAKNTKIINNSVLNASQFPENITNKHFPSNIVTPPTVQFQKIDNFQYKLNIGSEKLKTEQNEQQKKKIFLVDSIEIADQTGKPVDAYGISNVRLIHVQNRFLGIDYFDPYLGESISLFDPSQIVTIIRQGDNNVPKTNNSQVQVLANNALYFQFSNFLDSRIITKSSQAPGYAILGNSNRDSPLFRCMYLILRFSSCSVLNIFECITNDDVLMNELRIVFHNWMFCSRKCTSSDIYAISLSVDETRIFNKVKKVKNELKSKTLAPNSTGIAERNDILGKNSKDNQFFGIFGFNFDKNNKKSGANNIINEPLKFSWAKKANIAHGNSDNQSRINQNAKMLSKKSNKEKIGIIDPEKYEQILPKGMLDVSVELKSSILKLLKEEKLNFLQITLPLIEILKKAEKPEQIKRAKELISKLTQKSCIRVKNCLKIEQYVMDGTTA